MSKSLKGIERVALVACGSKHDRVAGFAGEGQPAFASVDPASTNLAADGAKPTGCSAKPGDGQPGIEFK
jgi:hypothetical protein